MDFSVFIFLSVMMIAFGYIASNSQNFNFAKLAFLGLFLIPFITTFDYNKAQLITMLVAFLIGYFLPYAHLLESLGDAFSDAINAIRYRDAYEDIKRKEAEVEELRRQYEQSQREANREKQEQEQQKRREQSQSYRKSQQEQKKQSSNKNKSKQKGQNSPNNSTTNRFLKILGLAPEKTHSYKDIKKAYKRQASKYHPDKHHSKGEKIWNEMNERFKEISEAYMWLAINS